MRRDPVLGFGFVAGSEKPVVVRSVTPGSTIQLHSGLYHNTVTHSIHDCYYINTRWKPPKMWLRGKPSETVVYVDDSLIWTVLNEKAFIRALRPKTGKKKKKVGPCKVWTIKSFFGVFWQGVHQKANWSQGTRSSWLMMRQSVQHPERGLSTLSGNTALLINFNKNTQTSKDLILFVQNDIL